MEPMATFSDAAEILPTSEPVCPRCDGAGYYKEAVPFGHPHFAVLFPCECKMAEKELRDLLSQHGFSIANMAYRVIEDGQVFEYRMVIRTTDPTNTSRLADDLRQLESVREFRISPTGD